MSNNLKSQNDNIPAHDAHDDASLKGTFVFVMGLGVAIVVSWLAVWALFLSRI
ncbi:cytochrome c oxidase subunit 2A [Anaerobacillus sp. MEB173]|uniref:cytochrome c oxidase subunit 2A n=1 Tax=Anaerobacillus sp. MEB173 TaxID=3383345 RepID=UPI003F93272C